MTPKQYSELTLLMSGYWPSNYVPPNEVMIRSSKRLWEGIPFDALVAAVESLAKDGRDWPPNPGQIARRAEELLRADRPPTEHDAMQALLVGLRIAEGNAAPAMPHPLISQVIKAMGGWYAIRDMDFSELRRVFERYYRQAVAEADREYFLPASARALRSEVERKALNQHSTTPSHA